MTLPKFHIGKLCTNIVKNITEVFGSMYSGLKLKDAYSLKGKL